METYYDLLGDEIIDQILSISVEDLNFKLSPEHEEILLEQLPKALLDDNDNVFSSYIKSKNNKVKKMREDLIFFDDFNLNSKLVEALFWTFDLYEKPAQCPFINCCLEMGRDHEFYRHTAAKTLKDELKDIVLYIKKQKPEKVRQIVEKLNDYIDLWHLI